MLSVLQHQPNYFVAEYESRVDLFLFTSLNMNIMNISIEAVSIPELDGCQLKWSWMLPDEVRAQTLKDRKYSLADQAGRQEQF